jgi:PAS domain S-box-containing protein
MKLRRTGWNRSLPAAGWGAFPGISRISFYRHAAACPVQGLDEVLARAGRRAAYSRGAAAAATRFQTGDVAGSDPNRPSSMSAPVPFQQHLESRNSPHPVAPVLRRAGFFAQPVAWVVLAIAMAASAGGWFLAREHAHLEAQKRFEEEAGRITSALTERMLIYQDVLHGAVGLYAASQSVERGEWRAYLESVGIGKRFPGIEGVGFAACVPRERLEGFVRATREDGVPDFAVRPDGTNQPLIIVKYLVPEAPHRALLGAEHSGDAQCRGAAEAARDSGEAVITGRVPLPDGGREPQWGFLMLVPVYRHGLPTATLEQRRAAIEGWVFARFIMSNLMREVLGENGSPLHFEVHDNRGTGEEKIIHRGGPATPPGQVPRLTGQHSLRLGGRTWALQFASTPAFDATVPKGQQTLMGVGGALISLLLFGIACSLSSTRARAVAIASEMTAVLRGTNANLEREITERRHAETVLQESEALYHSLVESLPLQILRKDTEGRLTFANQRFCSEVDRPLPEILGKTDDDFLPPALAAAHRQEDRQVLATGATLETLHELPQPDGRSRFLQAIKTPLRDSAGNIVGLLGIYWDVTDRRRAEEALEHERFLMNTLMAHVPDRIYFKDAHSRFLRVNHAMAALFQLRDPEEAVGKSDFDFFGADHARQAFEDEQKIIQSGQPVIGLVEQETLPDGKSRWALTTKMPLRDQSGGIAGTFGISRDYTALKEAEAALQELSALQEGILNSANYAIISTSTAGVVTTFNTTAEKMLGLTAAEVVGQVTPALWHDPAEVVRRAMVLSRELGRPVEPGFESFVAKARLGGADENEWTFIRKDGSRFPVLLSVTALRDSADQITGFLGVIADITDRKRAEEALRQAKEAAEEASRAKSQFLASMSHELRTPLNSVIGFANILLKNRTGNLTPSELNFLDRIVANGKHLLALINQILDLSKIEARKVELQLAPVALDALVRETLAQEEGLLRDRPVELLAQMPATVAPLVTDADKLKQVLINLLGNALKFTERGSVTVRVQTDPATHQPVRLDVADTGIGIPQEKLGVIFEAFQQAEAGTARKYGGTGLGLTISQALCQLMGCRLEVASEVGRGSTFSVVFPPPPTPPSPAPHAPSAPAALAASLERKVVLVIDDELDSRTLLEHMIAEFGCRVRVARSADEGLRMAREFRPHLITVDLMMPLVDGWEVVRALKADPHLQAIPVVVVSVVAGENRGRILGAVDVLQKPVVREALLAVLRRNLRDGPPGILVVDDDADARRLLASQLDDACSELRTAANGQEALEVLKNFLPDLILLDLVMPVMDGATFLNHLRADPRFASVAVVVITGKELTVSETEHLRRQAGQVLRKADVFASDLKTLLAGLLANPAAPPSEGPP